MTPKDKATELFDYMFSHNEGIPDEGLINNVNKSTNARCCALIAVYVLNDELAMLSNVPTERIQFWKEVEEELREFKSPNRFE